LAETSNWKGNDMHPAEHTIRERAYAIWEQEGRPDGREWDHWARAAGEVRSQGSTIAAASAQAAGKPARGKSGAKGKFKRALKSVVS
jgi:hypothetical protein